MAQDRTLRIEDERRLEQYETVKGTARDEIQARVRQQTNQLNAAEQAELSAMGSEFKQNAISEVRDTEVEIRRASTAARFSQVIDYLFYVIYGLISLEIVFDLLGARKTNGFRNLIDALSSPFLAPFKNLFPDPAAGRFQIRFSYIAALVIYLLLHLAINGLLRMIAHRKSEI
jgi:uncharacterized protein YggT (Ycf19 family)